MTTVAYRDGVMAADSAGEWSGIRSRATKIHRVNGVLIGGSGNVTDIQTFIRWFEAGADQANKPEFRQYRGADDAPEFEILIADHDGLTWWSEAFQPDRVEDDFWAIGTGRAAAMAAMYMGADAGKAVQIARLVDVHTNGDVQVERL
jgi:ATP-dependent protease HslVU (ClpYQ) peptidase subunit